MSKFVLLILMSTIGYFPSLSQFAVYKPIGKNGSNYKLGFGLFAYYDIPLNESVNRSLMIELLDVAYFPAKSPDSAQGYVSIKIGYRYIFSEESRTGFYVEPQLGYCRVVKVSDFEPDATYGDGIAAAFEGGYSLEVGQRGNAMVFGLKYEADLAGKKHTIHAISFRVGYSFGFLRRRSRDN